MREKVTSDSNNGAGVCRNPDLIDCTDYTTVLDKNGRNIIKGVILFEGWRPADMPHLGMSLTLVLSKGTARVYVSWLLTWNSCTWWYPVWYQPQYTCHGSRIYTKLDLTTLLFGVAVCYGCQSFGRVCRQTAMPWCDQSIEQNLFGKLWLSLWCGLPELQWSKSTLRVHTCMATGTIGAHQVVFTSGKPLKSHWSHMIIKTGVTSVLTSKFSPVSTMLWWLTCNDVPPKASVRCSSDCREQDCVWCLQWFLTGCSWPTFQPKTHHLHPGQLFRLSVQKGSALIMSSCGLETILQSMTGIPTLLHTRWQAQLPHTCMGRSVLFLLPSTQLLKIYSLGISFIFCLMHSSLAEFVILFKFRDSVSCVMHLRFHSFAWRHRGQRRWVPAGHRVLISCSYQSQHCRWHWQFGCSLHPEHTMYVASLSWKNLLSPAATRICAWNVQFQS